MAGSNKRVSRARKWITAAAMVVLMAAAFAFAHGSLRTFRIVSESMTPTLQVGDCVLVDARKSCRARRGDVLAVRQPDQPLNWFCKRAAGIPGDRVEFRDSHLYVNGEQQNGESYVLTDLEPISSRGRSYVFQLRDDEYYVLGDNQRDSYDSRAFGPVRRRDLIGVVTRIYWPPRRAHSLRAGSLHNAAP